MNSLGLLALATPAPAHQALSGDEVVIVRGWYAGASLTDIGLQLGGWHRCRVGRRIRDLRERGHALTPRPANWSDMTRRSSRG